MSADGLTVASALLELERSPLSGKRAMLLALLIDREVDRRTTADPLAARRRLATGDMGVVMQLAAAREGGPRLVVETVPLEDPEAAGEADYMVAVYNGGTVQRVLVAWSDGRRDDALNILRRAAGELSAEKG